MLRNPLLVLLLVATGACREGATTPSPADMAEMPADQIMYGLEHIMTRQGVRQALLLGDTAYMQQGGGKIDLVGVRLKFYDENGRESGDLTSQTGTYEMRLGTMLAEGNVVLNTRGEGGDRTIETERLNFDVNGDRLWSDQPVVMREGNRVIRGTSFTSDGRFQNVRVQQARTDPVPIGEGQGVTF